MTEARPLPTNLRALTALPVYNEEKYVVDVLALVQQFSDHVLVVNDGSTDRTAELLKTVPNLLIETHERNRGYGAALRTAFDYAIRGGYDVVITIDCDGQHEPQRIPEFVHAINDSDADVISGSRYLKDFPGDDPAPPERRRINGLLTAELNRRLQMNLTDAFCGFKAYRVSSLAKLDFQENGYAMPLEVWVRMASLGFQVDELAVPRIYLDEKRSFGGALDDAATRLEYYHLTLDRSIAALQKTDHPLPYEVGASSPLCGEATR